MSDPARPPDADARSPERAPGSAAAPPAPKKARRWLRRIFIALLVLVPIASVAGAKGWKTIKTDPQFCVSCHLMEHAGEVWKTSAHKDIICQTCHRADIFEEAKFGFNAYIMRAKEVPPHAPLDIKICAECHVSNDPKWKQVAATAGHREHFAERDVSCLHCHVTKLHEFGADPKACTGCHGEGKLQLSDMSKLHCLGCHDFLKTDGGDKASLIPTPARCRECHPAVASEEPPAAASAPATAAAPATATAAGPNGAAKKERLAETKLLAKAAPTGKGHDDCMGCHDPHGKKLEDPVGCLKCHVKLLAASNVHYKDERLQSCFDCHHPHKTME